MQKIINFECILSANFILKLLTTKLLHKLRIRHTQLIVAMTSEAILSPDLEATPASKAIKGYRQYAHGYQGI